VTTFYFTNVSNFLTIKAAREDVGPLAVMEDVFISSKLNRNG